MTGLVVGALRALWPWQGDDRGLLAPDAHVPAAVALAVSGAAVVLAIVAVERRVAGRDRVDPGGLERTDRRHARRGP
jgi:putative membrane protein